MPSHRSKTEKNRQATSSDLDTPITFTAPADWSALSNNELKHILKTRASFDRPTFRLLMLLHFGRFKAQLADKGEVAILQGKKIMLTTTLELNECAKALDWMADVPKRPWRPMSLKGHKTSAADLSDLTFGQFLQAENYFQGFLATKDKSLLHSLADILHPHRLRKQWHLEIILMWFISAKENIVRKFPDLYRPASGTSLSSPSVARMTDAQIRALTRGDITKEEEILDRPVFRALSELDAQAREYAELNKARK